MRNWRNASSCNLGPTRPSCCINLFEAAPQTFTFTSVDSSSLTPEQRGLLATAGPGQLTVGAVTDPTTHITTYTVSLSQQNLVVVDNPIAISAKALTNIYLGSKNSLTLVHWARKQRHLAHILIVAVTGDASFKVTKSAHDAGCDGCITKPVDFKILRQYLAGMRVHSGT